MKEYFRPWKLVTFAIGVAILLIGGEVEQLADWTPGVSIAMALATYITAPWAVRIFIERRWAMMPFAFLAGYFSVEVIYTFWQVARHAAPAMVGALAQANRLPSTCLYLLCGLLWMYRGSLKDFAASLQAALGSRPSPHR